MNNQLYVNKQIMKSQNQQSQIQPATESKLISVYKLIDQPKQLIQKQTINKLYMEIWESHPVDSIDHDKTITINYNNYANHRLMSEGLTASLILRFKSGRNQGRCSTQMQIRNTIKSTGRSRNTRYNNQDTKWSLAEMERVGQFGKLVYERVGGRINWNWVLKTENYFSIYQNYQSDNQQPDGLTFDSKFQSANLWKAYKSLNSNSNNPQTYTLITQNDTNTFGYNQWFYFRVKSDKPFQTFRFQIINMRKSYSSFNKGMKIAILSEKKWKEQKIGWHRGAANIEYTSNQIRAIKNDNQSLSTLGWDYSFESANEWVYFAYSYPYTYTELKMLIAKTKKYKSEGKWIELCLSCLKNEIHMLNINKTGQQKQKTRQKELSVELKKNKQETTESKKLMTTSIEDELFLQEKKQKSFCNPLIKKNRNRSRYLNLNLNLNANIKNRSERVQNISPRMKANSILNLGQQPSKQLQNKNETIQNVEFQFKQTQNAVKKANLNKFLKEFKNNNNKISKQQNNNNKQILIIMARAHPGQTPSSFVVEGVINSLLKQNQNQFKYLKQKLNIFIVPMLNPDGVIHGNTRTSLSGNDLNRRWIQPNQILHPQIYYIKQYFKDLISKGHKIFAMVDLHAHTRKQSSFFYGCCDQKNYSTHADTKLLNILMAKIENNFNSLYSSHYVGESKKSTARVTFYREFKCLSYTLESSFLGESQSSLHFSVKDYYNIGKNLLKSIAYLYSAVKWCKNQSIKGPKMMNQPLLNNMQLKQSILQHFQRYKRQQRENKRKQREEDEQKDSQGSSSAPSRDNYKQQFVLRNFFQGGKQVKLETRYRARSFNKVGKRNMSLSITDKPSLSQLQECGERKKNMTRDNIMRPKVSIKVKKIQIQSKQAKLPLINFQLKQEQPVYQFHAFNFKTKKGGRKRQSQIGMDSTIN